MSLVKFQVPSKEERKFIKSIQTKAHQTIKKYVSKGDRILLTCSGGKDSLALMHILHTSPLKPKLFMLTIDHGLRENSGDQSKYVYSKANKLNITSAFVTLSLDSDDENTARNQRHKYFNSYKGIFNCKWIATGHTASDQLETVLMRVIRGTGISGLGGIKEATGNYLRPLINLTAKDTERYVNAIGWSIQHDQSNDSDKYFRNRVRHNIATLMLEENPQVDIAVASLAEAAQEAEETLNYYANKELVSRVMYDYSEKKAVALKYKKEYGDCGLTDLPKGVVKKMIALFYDKCYLELYGRTPVNDGVQLTHKHINMVYSVLSSPDGGQLMRLPKMTMKKSRGYLVVKL